MKLEEQFLDDLAAKLPAWVPRNRVKELTDGLVASKTLANADSLGSGPAEKIYVGRYVAYPKEAFIMWLQNKCTRTENSAHVR